MFNAHHDLVRFTLPEAAGGRHWVRLLDTNLPDDQDLAAYSPGDGYDVTGRSLLMFAMRPDGDVDDHVRAAFQHVMQAFEEANVRPVEFGFPHGR